MVSLPAPATTVDVGEDLVAASAGGVVPVSSSNSALQQLGHEVVGRVLGPPVDVVGEHRRRSSDAFVGDLHRLARPRCAGWRRRGRGSPPGPARGCRAACRSRASASARRGRRRSRTARRRRAGRGCARRTRGSSARARSSSSGVNTRDSRPRWMVCDRRVLEDEDARRHLDVGLDQLEDRRRARRCSVSRSTSPRSTSSKRLTRVEVVLLVVVERRLLAQPAEHRVRVGVDLDVVRVVGHVGRTGHESSSRSEERDDAATGSAGSARHASRRTARARRPPR